MDNITQRKEIFDIFELNEKKARLRLVALLVLCLSLALLTVFFAIRSQKKSLQLEIQNGKIEKQALELAIAQDSLKKLLSKVELSVTDSTIREEIRRNLAKYLFTDYVKGTYNNKDGDGFVNLRTIPNGKVVKKIKMGEVFYYVNSGDKWSRVITQDSIDGYIKTDRIKQAK
jgi:hypothetical protein